MSPVLVSVLEVLVVLVPMIHSTALTVCCSLVLLRGGFKPHCDRSAPDGLWNLGKNRVNMIIVTLNATRTSCLVGRHFVLRSWSSLGSSLFNHNKYNLSICLQYDINL